MTSDHVRWMGEGIDLAERVAALREMFLDNASTALLTPGARSAYEAAADDLGLLLSGEFDPREIQPATPRRRWSLLAGVAGMRRWLS